MSFRMGNRVLQQCFHGLAEARPLDGDDRLGDVFRISLQPKARGALIRRAGLNRQQAELALGLAVNRAQDRVVDGSFDNLTGASAASLLKYGLDTSRRFHDAGDAAERWVGSDDWLRGLRNRSARRSKQKSKEPAYDAIGRPVHDWSFASDVTFGFASLHHRQLSYLGLHALRDAGTGWRKRLSGRVKRTQSQSWITRALERSEALATEIQRLNREEVGTRTPGRYSIEHWFADVASCLDGHAARITAIDHPDSDDRLRLIERLPFEFVVDSLLDEDFDPAAEKDRYPLLATALEATRSRISEDPAGRDSAVQALRWLTRESAPASHWVREGSHPDEADDRAELERWAAAWARLQGSDKPVSEAIDSILDAKPPEPKKRATWLDESREQFAADLRRAPEHYRVARARFVGADTQTDYEWLGQRPGPRSSSKLSQQLWQRLCNEAALIVGNWYFVSTKPPGGVDWLETFAESDDQEGEWRERCKTYNESELVYLGPLDETDFEDVPEAVRGVGADKLVAVQDALFAGHVPVNDAVSERVAREALYEAAIDRFASAWRGVRIRMRRIKRKERAAREARGRRPK